MPTCVTIAQANDFFTKEQNLIKRDIAKHLAQRTPWINVIPTDTFESGMSDVRRSVRQESVAPAISRANPVWAVWSCSRQPAAIETGTTEYPYTVVAHFEIGPKICVVDAYSSVKSALRRALDAIKSHTGNLWNDYIRASLRRSSAIKVTVLADATSLAGMMNGTVGDINTPFLQDGSGNTVLPTAPLSYKLLQRINSYLRDTLMGTANLFDGNARVITDYVTAEAIRNEAGVAADQRAVVSGGAEKNRILTYAWESPYRGLQFGIDPTIERAWGIDGDGELAFVEPVIGGAATKGVRAIPNPDYESAPYQVSYIMLKGSFVREIPQELLGEGMTKFEKQYWAGDVQWHNQKDNDCNIKGDTGFHYYDLAAALRPERPEFVIPILHQRCAEDLGLTTCTAPAYGYAAVVS